MKRGAPLKRTPMRRSSPKQARQAQQPKRERVLPARPESPCRAVMAASLAAEAPRADPKPETFRSEAWLAAVRQIPCVHCGGAVQAAHRNEGKGGAIKTDDCLSAALCPPEHTRIDSGKDLSRDERRAQMDRYIVLTLRELVHRGLVGVL